MTEHIFFLSIRSVTFLVCVYLGVSLISGFIKNHLGSKPRRSLVGWLGLFFMAVALEEFQRTVTRARFVFLNEIQNVNSIGYYASAILAAIAAVGVLWVWTKWPMERISEKDKEVV